MQKLSGLVITLTLLAVPLYAQEPADDIEMSRIVIVNSPDVRSWAITAHLTKVDFSAAPSGWIVDFDKRLGLNRWPDVITPGWDGPLQYTLWMCLKTNTYWTCSGVIEFWNKRIEEFGPVSHAPTDEIAKQWFYDPRWGELYNRQPTRGEDVVLFVTHGDARNTGVAFPGVIAQRSAARKIKWLESVGDYAGGGSGEIDPPHPIDPPGGGNGGGGGNVDMSSIRDLLRLTTAHDAGQERIFANTSDQIAKLSQKIDDMQKELDARIDKNGLERFLADTRVQAFGMAALGFFSARSQTLGSSQPPVSASAIAAASGLAVFALRK